MFQSSPVGASSVAVTRGTSSMAMRLGEAAIEFAASVSKNLEPTQASLQNPYPGKLAAKGKQTYGQVQPDA